MHSLGKFSVGLLLASILCLSFLGVHVVHADQLHATNPLSTCQDSTHYSSILDGVGTVYTTGSYCGSQNAFVETYLQNCASQYHDAEADTWQTRQITSGGTRYAETGKSGWVTYPPDCQTYFVQVSTLSFQQLTDPSYGCTWFAVDDNVNNSLDYQCRQFPRIS